MPIVQEASEKQGCSASCWQLCQDGDSPLFFVSEHPHATLKGNGKMLCWLMRWEKGRCISGLGGSKTKASLPFPGASACTEGKGSGNWRMSPAEPRRKAVPSQNYRAYVSF